MIERSRLTSFMLAAALGGCALAGPVLDPGMEDAPFAACYRFDAAADTPQCFTLVTEGSYVSGADLGSGRLVAGDRLRGMLSGAPGCPAAYFTHLTVSGDTSGAGAMRVEAHDAIGRGSVGDDFRWREARAGRHWVVDGIGSPVINPASFSIALSEGEVQLNHICFRSYER